MWHTNTDSGFVWFKRLLPVPYPCLKYKYPTSPGDTWDDGNDLGFLVVCTDTIISVPAGTFHCIRYQWIGYLGMRGEQYASPGTGIVKSIYYFSRIPLSNAIQSVTELKNYHLT